METKPQEKLSTLFAANPASAPSKELLRAITKWVGIFMEHHHKEISELGMVAYIEGLKDLSVEQVNRGCKRALKEVDRMPTVAHIRERKEEQFSDTARMGQKYNAPDDCEFCRGTGWKHVGDGKYGPCKH